MHLRGLEKIAMITLFRSRESELRLPADVASMHALNGQLAKYKLEVLCTKIYM